MLSPLRWLLMIWASMSATIPEERGEGLETVLYTMFSLILLMVLLPVTTYNVHACTLYAGMRVYIY